MCDCTRNFLPMASPSTRAMAQRAHLAALHEHGVTLIIAIFRART